MEMDRIEGEPILRAPTPDPRSRSQVLGNSYTLKADLWSLGVISYMLLTGSAREGNEGTSACCAETMVATNPDQS